MGQDLGASAASVLNAVRPRLECAVLGIQISLAFTIPRVLVSRYLLPSFRSENNGRLSCVGHLVRAASIAGATHPHSLHGARLCVDPEYLKFRQTSLTSGPRIIVGETSLLSDNEEKGNEYRYLFC